jgi:C-terminal peptidase prc
MQETGEEMTQPPPSDNRSLLQATVLAVLLLLISGGMAVYVLVDGDLKLALDFVRIATELEDVYPDPIDHERLISSARQAMLDKLDRYSTYIEARQFRHLREELSGAYSGIGVSVVSHDNGLMIMSVRENGPADRVGLLSGDIIVTADSVPLKGVNSEDATDLLRGEAGTPVTLGVYRPVSQDTIVVEIVRSRIELLHIPFAGFTPDSLIYVRVLDFETGAADDLRDVLDSLIPREAHRACGLILDLRGNPGGLLSEAHRTADLFLDGGRFIVGTDSRSRWHEERYYSTGEDVTGGLPIAVLIDRGSASAAEIVAGALGQLDRAILVGDTTFGKGLVQGLTRFPDGSGLRLTISRYYLEGGIYLSDLDSALNNGGQGLAPDYYVSYIERDPFPRALENSLVLRQFANLFQDEIIEWSKSSRLSQDWADRLARYAADNGFTYNSLTTITAEQLLNLALAEQRTPELVSAIREALHRSRESDKEQFERYHRYIETRLKQIAYERKYGVYRAYAEITVRERPDIQYAAALLKARARDE